MKTIIKILLLIHACSGLLFAQEIIFSNDECSFYACEICGESFKRCTQYDGLCFRYDPKTTSDGDSYAGHMICDPCYFKYKSEIDTAYALSIENIIKTHRDLDAINRRTADRNAKKIRDLLRQMDDIEKELEVLK